MEFIPGSIALSARPGDRALWEVAEAFYRSQPQDGIVGYRHPSCGIPDNDQIPSLIIFDKQRGVLLFHVVEDRVVDVQTDEEYWGLEGGDAIYSPDIVIDNYANELKSRFKSNVKLYSRRNDELKVCVTKCLVLFGNSNDEALEIAQADSVLTPCVIARDDLEDGFRRVLAAATSPVADHVLSEIIAEAEGTGAYQKKPKKKVLGPPQNKNELIQKSLEVTYKLDQTQRRIAMQLPDGPQRVRGLAGTGKTVILCLKAALALKNFPDQKILFLFNTQSMYGAINRYIEQYYIRETRQAPDWANIDVLHAWGGRRQRGLYSTLCQRLGRPAYTLSEAQALFAGDSLAAIYRELLRKNGGDLSPYYDMVLIDEAQDFPPEIFETVYEITRDPKRIVWAYDEFQSLKELRIPGPSQLFGEKGGVPNVPDSALEGVYPGGIDKDFILPNCYRMPRKVIMGAHGAALGLYRQGGIIDALPDARSWRALGYEVLLPEKPVFAEGDAVVIERPEEHSRNILERIIREAGNHNERLVEVKSFGDEDAQVYAICEEVAYLIFEEQIDPAEIIIVSLNTRTAKSEFGAIRKRLLALEIRCTTPGFVEGADVFKREGAVTLATPFRAKGNESKIVFVVNAQKASQDISFRGRNALFVAMTRAMGWCYVWGHGSNMIPLCEEFEKMEADYPRFKFTQPREADIRRRRMIIERDDSEVLADSETIDDLIKNKKDLLVEKLKSDPDLLDELQKLLNNKDN